MIRSIGFIGSEGKFAKFLADQVRKTLPGITIKGWDANVTSSHSREETAACDIVIFCVPPKKYEPSMREIIPLMHSKAIIVDICTVKVHTVKLLRELCGGRPYFAGHPMFGPQSLIDQHGSLKGLELVICEQTLPRAANAVLEKLLVKSGIVIRRMTPEDHDRDAAEEQLVTQNFGAILREAGFERSARRAHTKSSQHFYTAMEIVKDDGPLFDDASDLNPFWPEIEARLELAFAKRRLAAVQRRNGKH